MCLLLWRAGLTIQGILKSDARRKAYEPPGPDYKAWTWMELNQYAVVDFDIGSVYSPALVADLR
jgi:hypothetical protein